MRLQLRHNIDFYKKWRRFIIGSVAHLLTPPDPKEERARCIALQLQDPRESASLLFVYRLNGNKNSNLKWLQLGGLNEKGRYKVTDYDDKDMKPESISGEQLLREELAVELPARNSAKIFVIAAERSCVNEQLGQKLFVKGRDR